MLKTNLMHVCENIKWILQIQKEFKDTVHFINRQPGGKCKNFYFTCCQLIKRNCQVKYGLNIDTFLFLFNYFIPKQSDNSTRMEGGYLQGMKVKENEETANGGEESTKMNKLQVNRKW